jgi:hypothetical protein
MSSARGWTLGVASALIAGAVGLAPLVVRYWSARLGGDEGGRQTAARALKPAPPAPEVGEAPERPPSRAEPSAEPSDRRRLPARPEPAALELALDDEDTPELDGEPSTEPAPAQLALAQTEPSPPAAAAPAAPAHASEHQAAAWVEADDEGGSTPEEAPEPAPMRRVSITVLESRTQPGLCKGSSDAVDAREALVARFRAVASDGASLLYVDPRLAPGTQLGLVADLEQAESELRRVLQLAPPRPDVFAYYDTRLLLAGGCTNEDVVAYYDGALHVVPTHDDVAQSILHEYTHHALTAAGLIGPAWAQEGIAMHMAGETWWRGGWMARVLERPFSLEVMESAVPYTLRSDQAALFYAQSAAMVACAIRGDPRGLRGLVDSLAAGHDQAELSYQLPAASAPAAWRSCFNDLAR